MTGKTKNDKPTKRTRPLTKLYNKYAHLLAQDMKPVDAAREAGFKNYALKSTIYTVAKELRESGKIDDIRQRNDRIATGLGMDVVSRIAKFVELTGAKKIVTASHEGVITDEKAYDDGALQHKAAETLLKLCGDMPAERLEVEPGTDWRKVITSARETHARERVEIDITPAED